MRTIIRGSVLASFCFFFSALPGFGQTSSGTIRGTVTDQSGGAVADAEVHVVNVATNVSHPSRTNEQGVYVVPLILPGRYTVEIEKPGFQAARHPGILLQVA